jgi:hypothetical protein
MQRTRYKYLVSLIFTAVISSVVHAEKGDNTAPPSAEQKPAAHKTTSYFQGTWVGNWQSESRDGTGRDVTITVGPKNPDGTFDIEYSWGSGKDIKGRHIIPGTVITKGREDGEKLVCEFNDPLSLTMNSIVMTKHEDVRAKAQTNFEARKLAAYLTRK